MRPATACPRQSALRACLAAAAAAIGSPPATARNLPQPTAASGAARGTVEALRPIVRSAAAVAAAAAAPSDLDACTAALARLPDSETPFKRLFDEYSEGVSYKQTYLDQNAFLVYYTRGFDGAGRPSIEAESAGEALQKAQYGARNDAWIAVDDARQEVQFLRAHPPARPHTMHTLAPPRATLRSLCLQADADEYSELRDALRRARAAFDSYLALAPAEQVSAAREAEGREGGGR